MYNAEFKKFGKIIVFEVVGNGFLHHMIRNFVGSLLKVGIGVESPEWIEEVLESRDRTRASVTAEPDGLYFVGVGYEEFTLERKVIDTFI
jgi:tRNA pseudouridine38-40 synthase